MEMDIDFDLGITTNGWICDGCGYFVHWSEYHACPTPYLSFPPTINIPFTPPLITISGIPPERDNELHDKLDEILKLLRRLT